MRTSLRLKSVMIMAAFSIFAIIATTSGFTFYKSERIKEEVKANVNATNTMQEILEAKSNIFQIQQFLTDVSLTGDKGGIREAQENYDFLVKHLSEISKQNPSLLKELEEVKIEAKQLLDVGNQMVDAYLLKGKAAGDAVMKRKDDGLDDTSEKLGLKMDALVKRIVEEQDAVEQVEGIVGRSKKRLDSVIQQSKQTIEDGLTTARECENAFETIVHQVTEVTSLTEEIVTAISEQKKGLQEIGNAIHELEKTTSYNSQTANTASETSDDLVNQMEGLNTTILAIRQIVDGHSKAA